MAGWFVDELGSLPWGMGWESWSTGEKEAYYDGAVALTSTFRRVADRHGLLVVVNGTRGTADRSRPPGAATGRDPTVEPSLTVGSWVPRRWRNEPSRSTVCGLVPTFTRAIPSRKSLRWTPGATVPTPSGRARTRPPGPDRAGRRDPGTPRRDRHRPSRRAVRSGGSRCRPPPTSRAASGSPSGRSGLAGGRRRRAGHRAGAGPRPAPCLVPGAPDGHSGDVVVQDVGHPAAVGRVAEALPHPAVEQAVPERPGAHASAGGTRTLLAAGTAGATRLLAQSVAREVTQSAKETPGANVAAMTVPALQLPRRGSSRPAEAGWAGTVVRHSVGRVMPVRREAVGQPGGVQDQLYRRGGQHEQVGPASVQPVVGRDERM